MAKKKGTKKAALQPEESPSESPPMEPESASPSQPTVVRPKTSPYISDTVTLYIGPNQITYHVPDDRLKLLGSVASCRSWNGSVHLPDVDESTGHVLAHYLYTGTYQTLDDVEPSPAQEEADVEFKRAFLAYATANKYSLSGIRQLAKQKIEQFGAEINILRVVEAIKGDFAKLGSDDVWFHNYLEGKAKTAFEEDYTVYSSGGLFDGVEDVGLAKLMAKCLVGLYNEKVEHMVNAERERVATAAEDCGYDVQDSAVEEAQPEQCCASEEVPLEGCLPEECCATEEAPPEECSPEECCAIEETPTEECVPDLQNSMIEAQVEEAIAIEQTFAEECPTSEMYPAQDSPINYIPVDEPAIDEPAIDEPAIDEPAIDEPPIEAPPVEKKVDFDFSAYGWNTSICGWGGTKKKGKMYVLNELVPEDPPPPPPKLESEADGLPVLAPEAPPPPPADEWATSRVGGSKKKKKGKKCASPPPAPEPEVEDWGLSAWGSSNKKKANKYADEPPPPEPEPEINEPPPPPPPVPELGVNELLIPAPEPPPPADDDWSSFAVRGGKKKKNKGKKCAPSPLEPEPEATKLPITAPEPEPLVEDAWAIFAVAGVKKKEGKKGTLLSPEPEKPTFMPEEPAVEPDEPPVMPEEPIEVEDGICSVRAKHLLGDEWKNCKPCRAILRQVAIQIARAGHADEVGYVMVDQALMT